MKIFYWKSARASLSDKNMLGLTLFFLFSLTYVITTGVDHRKIKLFLFCLVLTIALLVVKNIKQPILWFLFLIILINDLICDYLVRANHHFLMVYMTISVIIFLSNSKTVDFLRNIQLVTAIILFFSGIHKLISPQFISGDFYYYMINTGSFFKPILYFNHEMNDIVLNNKNLISELGKEDPINSTTITLQNVIPNLDIISRAFAWFTIIIELIVGIAIVWKPKSVMTHLLFIMLVVGIFFTRLENGFLTLLAICGIWLSENHKITAVYLFLAIISMAFVITEIGFH
ncbi:hypothetical protein M0G43_00130 [Subsaxibacter sp. CAU 1640]|uniref:hypothetical protein n=1 Tax=Subsaxibacter sp. CAU 1640 TaxID=2933271 RepID=UPI0020049CD3|nr:hypothetical protein [Subsaxibacter sp. CAU 1640]MCK7588970.1 hypothetical protein [Subsaxibacter sp. CAU 1640]